MTGLNYAWLLYILCRSVFLCYGDPSTTMTSFTTTSATTAPPSTTSTTSTTTSGNTSSTTVNTTSATSESSTNTTRRPDRLHRERYMIRMIQETFMRQMGWSTLPTVSSDGRTFPTIDIIRNVTTEERVCSRAACTLPNYIHQSRWFSPSLSAMNLYFNVAPRTSGNVRIKNATLNLFVTSREACNCDLGEEDVRLLVEVNQYLPVARTRQRGSRQNSRRLRRNRQRGQYRNHNTPREIRTRYLDLDILVWNNEQWMEFDVTNAVNDWIIPRNRRRRNYGLEIKVERIRRTAGRRITDFDAYQVFGHVNCNFPIEYGCLRMGTQSPFLDVWIETLPIMNKRKRRSLGVTKRQFFQKKAKLLKKVLGDS